MTKENSINHDLESLTRIAKTELDENISKIDDKAAKDKRIAENDLENLQRHFDFMEEAYSIFVERIGYENLPKGLKYEEKEVIALDSYSGFLNLKRANFDKIPPPIKKEVDRRVQNLISVFSFMYRSREKIKEDGYAVSSYVYQYVYDFIDKASEQDIVRLRLFRSPTPDYRKCAEISREIKEVEHQRDNMGFFKRLDCWYCESGGFTSPKDRFNRRIKDIKMRHVNLHYPITEFGMEIFEKIEKRKLFGWEEVARIYNKIDKSRLPFPGRVLSW
jgi:hypothetical protein